MVGTRSAAGLSDSPEHEPFANTAVEKQNITAAGKSSVEFDFLEGWVGGRVQEFIQVLLEKEVEQLLGRQK